MNNLIRLIGRRLVALPVMVFGVAFLVFFLMSFSKVDPAYNALGEGASQEAILQYHIEHGLDKPWLERFWHFIVGMLQGDLGTYGASQTPVANRIASALPITLQLTFIGLFMAVIVATLLGVLAALYRDRWVDQIIRVFSIICVATPSFWLAIMMILLLSINFDLFAASGELVPFTEDPKAYLNRMLMPTIALAFPVAGSLTRVIRTAVVEELDKDYVRTAIGAGIPKTTVVARNVLRNALITPVTVLGMRIGYLMGGAVVIEKIFNLQGMGFAIIEGVQGNETDLVQGVTLVVAITFIIINIVVDMLYILINPRIRTV